MTKFPTKQKMNFLARYPYPAADIELYMNYPAAMSSWENKSARIAKVEWALAWLWYDDLNKPQQGLIRQMMRALKDKAKDADPKKPYGAVTALVHVWAMIYKEEIPKGVTL